MVVFHHHDYSTNFSGPIQGSNIATGKAHLSNSSAVFNTPNDVAAELRALKILAAEFSKTNQETILRSLDFLASATEKEVANKQEIIEHIQTITEISPKITERLNAILTGTGTSMLGSAIIEGIKFCLGG